MWSAGREGGGQRSERHPASFWQHGPEAPSHSAQGFPALHTSGDGELITMQSMVPCVSLEGTSRLQASIFQSAEWEGENPVSLPPPGEQLADSPSPQAQVAPDTRGVRMCLESILMPHSGGYGQGPQGLGLTAVEILVSER